MPASVPDPSHGLVGRSPQIAEIRRLIHKLGRSRVPVLLLGPSGTGKEIVARGIYAAHPAGQFVPIDCGTLVGPLMESELFGHERGAFTGALQAKQGLIELADGGTAFLDEIGDLPLEMQVKLLRLLQEQEFRPVGSLRFQKVQVRIIAATKHDLPKLVEQGKFREDLYYRLNVVKIQLPPLRERREDIPLLIDHFLERLDSRYTLSPELMELMVAHDWPGNVRQLRNCLERMTTLSSESMLDADDLPSFVRYMSGSSSPAPVVAEDLQAPGADHAPLVRRQPVPPRIDSLRQIEKRAIMEALAFTSGDRVQAARLLEIGRTTLYRKLKEYQIET